MAEPNQKQSASPTKTSRLVEKLRVLRDALSEGLVERDVPIRLALLAALAGEHLLMVGPPGTAKSLVARRLHLAFDGASYFERLLTRFTVPEELFGPLSIKGLEQDRYERLTDAYLPTASIAFLDEIFKANSAILNALLTLLNEREFDNGAVREKTPLVSVIGASNELPEGEELDALFDRFLLRLHVGYVSKEGFRGLLGLRDQREPDVTSARRLSRSELDAIRTGAEIVEVPNDVTALLCDLREFCSGEGMLVSDRRWRKVVKLLQVSAYTNGRESVSIWDCWLLQHCLWNTPDAREKVYEWYATRVGASAAMDPSRLTKIVQFWESKLKTDKESRSQMRDAEGHLLFKGKDGKHTREPKGRGQVMRGPDPAYLAPANAKTRIDYSRLRLIEDRSNGGKGYTRNELEQLEVPTSRHGGDVTFSQWSGRDSYLTDQNNWLLTDVDLTPVLEPTRHQTLHIEGSVREIDALRTEVESYREQVDAHIASLESDIRTHLWVTADFCAPAAKSLAETRDAVRALLDRIASVRKGFESLPREAPHSPDGGEGQSASRLLLR